MKENKLFKLKKEKTTIVIILVLFCFWDGNLLVFSLAVWQLLRANK